MSTDTFTSQIFNYIRNEYGGSVLKKVQLKKNETVTSKLLESSSRQNDDVEHAANKIIAMLRLNP